MGDIYIYYSIKIKTPEKMKTKSLSSKSKTIANIEFKDKTFI